MQLQLEKMKNITLTWKKIKYPLLNVITVRLVSLLLYIRLNNVFEHVQKNTKQQKPIHIKKKHLVTQKQYYC